MREIPEGVRATVNSIHHELKSEVSSKLSKKHSWGRESYSELNERSREMRGFRVDCREGDREGNERAKRCISRKEFFAICYRMLPNWKGDSVSC